MIYQVIQKNSIIRDIKEYFNIKLKLKVNIIRHGTYVRSTYKHLSIYDKYNHVLFVVYQINYIIQN